MDTISVSQALQIAGRAGRYGTQYDKVIINLYNCILINVLLCVIKIMVYILYFSLVYQLLSLY